MSEQSKPWFAAKRFGYGAGLPIAWQGWALLGGYIAIVLLCAGIIEWDEDVGLIAAAPVFLASTIGFVLLCKARTRGGWRWRSGADD